MSLRDLKATDMVRVAAMHAESQAEIAELRAERDKLRAQMPAEMKNCTIVFRECPEGHGRLTATNWVQHSCLVCENERLMQEGLEANRELAKQARTDAERIIELDARVAELESLLERSLHEAMDYQTSFRAEVRTALAGKEGE